MSTEIVGDALFDLGARLWNELRLRVGDIADWVVEVITPPDDLELTDREGRRYSGLLLLEKGRVVAMIAVEVGQRDHRPMTATAYQRPREHDPVVDPAPDSPFWDRDGDPFRR